MFISFLSTPDIGDATLDDHIDKQLRFSKYIKTIIKNLSFKVGKLSKIRDCLTKRTALLMYNAMIVPICYYGDSFYNFGGTKSLVCKLQTLQNSAIRTICRLPKRTNTIEHESKLGLLRLERRQLT